jgi:hypothetical protein
MHCSGVLGKGDLFPTACRNWVPPIAYNFSFAPSVRTYSFLLHWMTEAKKWLLPSPTSNFSIHIILQLSPDMAYFIGEFEKSYGRNEHENCTGPKGLQARRQGGFGGY